MFSPGPFPPCDCHIYEPPRSNTPLWHLNTCGSNPRRPIPFEVFAGPIWIPFFNNGEERYNSVLLRSKPVCKSPSMALLLAVVRTVYPAISTSTSTNTTTTHHPQIHPHLYDLLYNLVQSTFFSRMASHQPRTSAASKTWVLPPTPRRGTR
jgi:hypothetical protein